MPWSSQIFIGVIFKDIDDAIKFFNKYNLLLENNDMDKLMKWNKGNFIDNIRTIKKNIILNGQIHKLKFYVHLGDEQDNGYIWKSKSSGKEVAYSVLYGAELTSRYKPSILDRDWKHGRCDPFVLDLEEILEIRTQVGEFLPEAEIILMDVFYLDVFY